MSIIRGGLLTFVSVCFLITILASGIFLTLTSSLTYENIEGELVPVVKNLIEKQTTLQDSINRKFPVIQKSCENNSEYSFVQESFKFTLFCDDISKGTDYIIESGIKKIVKEKYYQNYNCDFWKCFKSETLPFFLVSEKAHDYWKSKFNLAFLLSSILFIGIFFLSEKKSNALILSGSILVLNSILLKSFSWLLLKITLSSINLPFTLISLDSFKFLIVSLGFVFIGMLFLGIGLILFGIGFRVWTFFREKNKIEKEDVEKIVEEKIEKKKKQK